MPNLKNLINSVKEAKFDSTKHLFVQPNADTKKIHIIDFVSFVSKTYESSLTVAGAAIENGDVTVNGNVVLDVNYALVSGDVVRVDIGHYLRNSGYMAVAE